MSHYALFFDRMVVEFRKHVALDLAFASKTSRMWNAVNAVRRECQDVYGIVECLELECQPCFCVVARVRRTLCTFLAFAEDVIHQVASWIAPAARSDRGGCSCTLRCHYEANVIGTFKCVKSWELQELRSKRRDMLRGRVDAAVKRGSERRGMHLHQSLRGEANGMREWLERIACLCRSGCSSLRRGI